MYRKNKLKDLNWDESILFEAPEDAADGAGDSDLQATDYGEVEDVDIEEVGPEDYSETGDDEGDPTGEEPPADGEENPDDLGGEGEPTDDSNMDGTETPDENPEDEQTDNADGNMKNEYLIGDFIELYNRMNGIIERINIHRNTKGVRNPVLIQAKDNMDKVRDLLYDYITTRFNKESYIVNLYQFNLIIQAINVNIELLERGLNYDEDDKKKKKR